VEPRGGLWMMGRRRRKPNRRQSTLVLESQPEEEAEAQMSHVGRAAKMQSTATPTDVDAQPMSSAAAATRRQF